MIKKIGVFIFLLLLLTPVQQLRSDETAQHSQMARSKKRRSSIFAAAIDAPEASIETMLPDAQLDLDPGIEELPEHNFESNILSPAQEDIATVQQTAIPSTQEETVSDRAMNTFLQDAAMPSVDEPEADEPTQTDTPYVPSEQISPEQNPFEQPPSEQTSETPLSKKTSPGLFDQAIGNTPKAIIPERVAQERAQEEMSLQEVSVPTREVSPTEDDDLAAQKTSQSDEQLIDILHKPSEVVKREAQEALAASEAPPEQDEDEDTIEFYFEDADIQNLLTQISELYDVTFITDDIFDPMGPGGKALKGNKISFKTHKPLSRKAAWGLFLTFLDLAGFALVPEADPGFYRVVTADKAQKSPVPTYIGVDADTLPENDQVVRYVYFIENARADTIKDIVNALKSPNARAVVLQQLKALVLTDKAYNIRSLMQIIKELDQVSMPQSMSVLKLQRADAMDVKKLYDEIGKTNNDSSRPTSRLFAARKQPTSIYFPENARIIAEPRTNSLILLGPANALKKIESFITRFVDVELEKPYSPLHTYQLRYASAVTIAEIMSNMAAYGGDTQAGKTGGVRGEDKYLKPMSFTAEETTNSIIIKGDYEDYLKAMEVIKKLDEPQPQVAVEALILTINFEDAKELGTQLRNKIPGPDGLLGANVDFQTSGIRLGGDPQGIQTRDSGPGATRLLANLISLVVGKGAGNTVVSLGTDAFGVWGIFNILQSVTNTQVVSNPFLVATNKSTAKVQVGQIRRVVTSTIFAGDISQGADAFGDFSAQLKLEVTPQINSDGMIVLDLDVLLENFISPLASTTSVAKQSRIVQTKTIVADREVIALGGLIQNRVEENLTKVPILGDIPILGWLFRNKRKDVRKDNLLILISTRIIEPEVTEIVDEHTQAKIEDYHNTLDDFKDSGEYRDPIYRRFFDPQKESSEDLVEDFLFERANAPLAASQPLATLPMENRPASLYQSMLRDDPEKMKEAVAQMPQKQRELKAEQAVTRSTLLGYIDKESASRVSKPAKISTRRNRNARRNRCHSTQKGATT